MEALLLIGATFGVLWGLWSVLDFTFNLIDQWHAASRERREVSSANIGERDIRLLVTAIVLTLISVPSAQASSSGRQHPTLSGRAATEWAGMATGSVTPQPSSRPDSPRCKSARIAAVYFRFRTWTHQELRDGRLASKSPIVAGKSCHWAKFAARVWEARAKSARRSFYRWLNDRTLRDFAFAPGADAWPKAVREVQRVFPGTEGWLLSCSDAEGWSPGFDRWVGYSGVPYSVWLRDSDTVGGPLQFRYSTFTGMFRRAVDHVYAHGFRVPIFPDYTAAWRSALGQALAGGWARASGNDDSHWSASWGSGC